MIGRCLAVTRLLAVFSVTHKPRPFFDQNSARKVDGRWPGSSLATCKPGSDRLSGKKSGMASAIWGQPQENLRKC